MTTSEPIPNVRSYRADLIENVFFIRWEKAPRFKDTNEVYEQILEAAKRVQKPMILVSVLAADGLPNAENRKHLNLKMNELKHLFSGWNIVIEGTELTRNLQRVMSSGMILLSRIVDSFAKFHSDGKSLEPVLGAKIVNEARARGLLTT